MPPRGHPLRVSPSPFAARVARLAIHGGCFGGGIGFLMLAACLPPDRAAPSKQAEIFSRGGS
jgi:hypothetical protein